MDPKFVYMIQSKQNGYVHCVFDSLIAARVWITKYESKFTGSDKFHPYDIIARELFSNSNQVGANAD